MQLAAEWLGGYIWLTAFVLGALHALQPGHGKTIVAAYPGARRAPFATPSCWAWG